MKGENFRFLDCEIFNLDKLNLRYSIIIINTTEINIHERHRGLTISGRFWVLEWHTVTVAWFHFNKSAIGDPTILLRPRTTAVLPATDTPT